ncbi:MAG TPA: acetoacetate decarboxylase family protein [Candidatus Eisenbacteria bacterium]|nr:acetoacetate decarboxylase family protein [Candidatus Eisenbacteria bacterium]
MAAPSVTEPRHYVFQGREVTLPVVVRDASSTAATYAVDATAARALLRGPELDVVEIFPGQALFSIACIDYRDNDLGDYNEVSLALFVRLRGERPLVPYLGNVVDFFRNRLATYIVHLPVTQSFTRDAGEGIWGFPKTVQRIEFEDTDRRRTCTLDMDGRHVLRFSSSRGGRFTLPDVSMTTYGYVDGVLHRTGFTAGATEVGFGIGGAELALGDHPIADELRRLGLPRMALMTVWMGHQHGRFEAPVRVET